MRIQWHASVRSSCCYAAEALHLEDVVHVQLLQALAGPAHRIAARLERDRIAVVEFWQQMLALSLTSASLEQQVAAALSHLDAKDPGIDLAGLLDGVRRLQETFSTCLPGIDEDLQLRCRPLREQWEARGPGLLREVQRRTFCPSFGEPALVVAVFPARGGHGALHTRFSQFITLEAVLANPVESLPEILRLGWLLMQLGARTSGVDAKVASGRFIALGLLPPILAAAERVELAACNATTLQLALDRWCVDQLQLPAAQLAETLLDWWNAQRASSRTWHQAIGDLPDLLVTGPAGP